MCTHTHTCTHTHNTHTDIHTDTDTHTHTHTHTLRTGSISRNQACWPQAGAPGLKIHIIANYLYGVVIYFAMIIYCSALLPSFKR